MFLIFALLLAQQPATDASKLSIAAPSTIAVVDVDAIDGEPWRLSWAPDNQQIYLAAMKRKDTATVLTHHLIDPKSGAVQKLDTEPAWAAKYWQWKSWKAAPGNPAFVITLDTQKKNESATARPMGGDLARGGVDPGGIGSTVDDVAGQASRNVEIITMLLKGEVVGRWENPPIVPGLTFGWGPRGSQLIAFANKDGRLVLMDEQGRKQRLSATKETRLPAWSEDGSRLAWVEKQDKKKFRIQLAAIQ
jgi:hypothetical protein